MSDTMLDRLDAYCSQRERAMDAAEERGHTCIDERASLGVAELRSLILAAHECQRLAREVERLRAEGERARIVLRSIAYCVTDEDTSLRVCPCCSGIGPWQNPIIGDGDTVGHTDNCALRAALETT